MNAWLFQDSRQKAALGDKCPWSVGWYDADGRKRSKKVGTKSVAEKFRQKTTAQLSLGLVTLQKRVKWTEFRKQFESDGLTGRAEGTVREYMNSMDAFQRIIDPVYMDTVNTAAIDAFVSARAKEPGRLRIPKAQAAGAERKQKRRKPPQQTSPVSPATINKDLRHLRFAFKKAKKWNMLAESPEVAMLPVAVNDPYYVDDATFKLLYDACDQLSRPAHRHYKAGEWWKALLCFAYLTGWRISEILSLKRADLDLETGVATVAAGSTKGRRTARIELHPAVVYQLRQITDFSELVFDWPHHKRTLWDEFQALKKAAGVTFAGAFHRFRFGFANANVDNLDADLLQKLMRHQDAKTTQIYINAAKRMQRAGVAEKLHAPGFLPRDAG